MKYIKSSFVQKLIIILVIIMIFNVSVPKQVNAWDIAGVLFKPIYSLITTTIAAVDVMLGASLVGGSWALDKIGELTEKITDNPNDTFEDPSGGDTIKATDFFVGPDTIFAGKVEILDANYFKATPGNGFAAAADMVGTIKAAIARVYVILRNICALVMLAGLIFTGIRVLLSSNIPTKMAQWKTYLQDWLIGLVLLMFSHFIMYGVFYISDTLTYAFQQSLTDSGINWSILKMCLESWDSATQIVCIIMLLYLLYLTVIFVIAYFKRLMWIAVLIILAPVVSVMYAFSGNNKSIYSKWLREYIMTVFVQPFHMITYTVLVIIPLDLTQTNSSNTLAGFSVTSMFSLAYALGAITFIRPAEKYIRELFGMDKGLANMASYDSGKNTLDAVVKTVAKVAAVAVTAGAAAPALAAGAAGGAAAGAAGEAVGAAGEALNAGGAGLEALGDGSELMSLAEDTGMDSLPNEIYDENISRDPFHDDYFANDPYYDNNMQTPNFPVEQQMDEEELQGFLDNMGLEEGSEDRAEIENELRRNGHRKTEDDYKETEEQQETQENITSSNSDNMGLEDKMEEEQETKGNSTNSSSDNNNINATNVTITASNVNMQGDIESIDIERTGKEESQDSEESEEGEEKADKKSNNDDNITIKNPGKDEVPENIRKGSMLKNFMAVATGQQGLFETLSQRPARKTQRKIQDKIAEGSLKFKTLKDEANSKPKKFVAGVGSGLYEWLTGFGTMSGKFKESKRMQFLTEFEKLGGMKELHQGFNEIRDTFYAGQAPGDWKTTNARMGERIKERQEEIKAVNYSTNNNKWLVDIYEAKLRDQYPDRRKYSDAWIKDQAKEKANSKLKSLGDTYAPLGIADARVAYECDEDCKKFGLTPKEAMKERADFEKFNVDAKNISYINEHFNVDNATSVSEAIEPAREYYNNGYRNVEDMSLVKNLTTALNVSMEKGMQLDQVLRKKGGEIKIDYEKAGISEKQKQNLDKILDKYKENNGEAKENHRKDKSSDKQKGNLDKMIEQEKNK